ncbi:isocitrate/isopropylmalate dehydrogenase family protein [Actinomyces sp. MRS3W]|uniref:isocitrate/isopropylmalate dehydrogenase family protein n=1 Tax=Actinomyces sp. MRS3W TaxID=2800796 RepID=UPI0028FD972C|nr:isocitrate/isopropylmalate dehydrogenase family protein [Actinomyces sp. MRS3W]MDU0347848.1 isocitrate/isopropylmalate dehydrogenase family protein [Actinomyces sp. MRS3W]
MSHNYHLGVLLGDAIGPEIVPVAVRAVDAAMEAAGAGKVEWEQLPLGFEAIEKFGEHTPMSTLKALEATDGWLLGPHDSASYPEPLRSTLNPSGTIRKHFGLFANIRPARSFPGQDCVKPGTDLVIVRENTEGFYADRNTFRGTGEMMPTPDMAIMHGIITREGSRRIAVEAFTLAEQRRKHVTIVHKANVLRMTTGLFRDVAREVAKDFPDVTVDDFHIDAMTTHLVRRAPDFDVIVTENMFGDILSDLSGELAGSLGIAPSLNSSADRAMAQASHGSAPDIAGRDIANPIAMIGSAAMLLRWLGSKHDDTAVARAGDLIDRAVEATVTSGTSTPDMGGASTCSGFGEALVDQIGSLV